MNFTTVEIPTVLGKRFILALPNASNDPIVAEYKRGANANDYIVQALTELSNLGDEVVDLGCHVGTFSIPAAIIGHRVLSVDASQLHIDLVKESCMQNGIANLTAVKRVVTKEVGPVQFHENGLFGAIDFENGYTDSHAMQGEPLNVILESNGFHNPRFIKADVEGAELFAFQAIPEILKSVRPAILYESNGPTFQLAGYNIKDMREFLEAHDYKTFRIEGEKWIYADIEQIQPEAWLDVLALPPSDVERFQHKIEWRWPINNVVERCKIWADLEYPSTKIHLLNEIKSRSIVQLDDIAKKLEHELSQIKQ